MVVSDKLGIFVITYNRADKLRATLASLAASPFSKCAIHVLDNHSEDDTPAVCDEFRGVLEWYTVIRHRVNVGLTPNYLRAVELSQYEYTWVLSDDDRLHFEAVSPILHHIENAASDLIVIGAVNQPQWNLGIDTTARQLLDRGFPYFYITGLVSGVIFRTSRFTSDCFLHGYKNADNYFPHFYFFVKCLRQDVSVYVADTWMIRDREPSGSYGKLASDMKRGWMCSARYLEGQRLRRLALRQILGEGQAMSYLAYARLFLKMFCVHKIVSPATLLDTWLRCVVVSPWDIRLTLLPSGLLCAMPGRIITLVRSLYGLLARRSLRPIQMIASQLDEGRT